MTSEELAKIKTALSKEAMSDNVRPLLVLELDQDEELFAALRKRLLDAGINENDFGPGPRRKIRPSGLTPGRQRTAGRKMAGGRKKAASLDVWTYVVPWVLNHLATPAVAIAALKAIRVVLVEWIKARAGRRFVLRIEGMKLEVRGSLDIDKCVAALEKHSTFSPKKPKANRSPRPPGSGRKKKTAARIS